MLRPVPDPFACFWNGQLQQARLINAEQVVIRLQPSPHIEECLGCLLPFLFKHCMRKLQGVALYSLMLFLCFGDVSIYGEQLLLQRI